MKPMGEASALPILKLSAFSSLPYFLISLLGYLITSMLLNLEK